MEIDEKVLTSIETLEAIYFLLKSYDANRQRLSLGRALLARLEPAEKSELLRELSVEIDDVREKAGALAENQEYRELLRDARKHVGRAYLSKLFIDSRVFSHYEKVFPRWPDIKPHALVVFDGHTMEDLQNILEVESLLFADIKLLLERAREAHKNIDDFRLRDPQDQERLQGYLRTTATTIFHFLEAYLNGLAYDCFQTHHDSLSIEDHDMLSERDSVKNRTKYVPFNEKLFRFPVVVGNAQGTRVDLSHFKAAHFLANEGKSLRDALTHPSYYVNWNTGFQEKILFAVGVNLVLVDHLFECARQYVTFVEESLGRNPERTVPWLF